MGEAMILIGNKIKELRETNGFTQTNIANYLNVDQSLISKIEKGERASTSDMLDKLACLFGVPISAFNEAGSILKPLVFDLRASEIKEEDLESISAINRIALNCNFITKLIEENHVHR